MRGNGAETVILTDVAYVLKARFEITAGAMAGESAGQQAAMFRRRMAKRDFYRRPVLGLSVFDASIELLEPEDAKSGHRSLAGEINLGWLPLDARHDREALAFLAIARDGTIDVSRSEMPCPCCSQGQREAKLRRPRPGNETVA